MGVNLTQLLAFFGTFGRMAAAAENIADSLGRIAGTWDAAYRAAYPPQPVGGDTTVSMGSTHLLHGDVTITIHTHQTQAVLAGREPTQKNPHRIMGLQAFSQNMVEATLAAERGNPDAAMVIARVEGMLKDAVVMLEKQRKDFQEKLDTPLIKIQVPESISPVTAHIGFGSIHAHWVASVIIQHDTVVRMALAAAHVAMIDREESYRCITACNRHIRRVFEATLPKFKHHAPAEPPATAKPAPIPHLGGQAPDKGNTEEHPGETTYKFMHWLSEGIDTCSLSINTDGALLHTLEEGLLLVSPQIFQKYSPDNWGYVLECFGKGGFHKQTPDSGNTWLYAVRGQRALVHGFLMPMPLMSFMGLGFGSGAAYLPKPNPALSPIDDTGQRFLNWLSQGLRLSQHKLNTHDAFLHTVKEGLLLLSPRVFKEFAGENGWGEAQKRFTKLGLHRKTPDGGNIWLYNVRGGTKSGVIRGFLLENPLETLMLAYLPVPNKSLSLPDSQPNIPPKPPAAKIQDTTPPSDGEGGSAWKLPGCVQEDTNTAISLQNAGIPHPVAEPDGDTNNIPSDGDITAPTVIPAEPDAPNANNTPPASDDWMDGFAAWLRQQMLDGKCPQGVVTVGHGKLLVWSLAFVAYCHECEKSGQHYGSVSKKFRVGLGITNTVKYHLPMGKAAGGKQPSYIQGILVTSPGKALNLPQSAIPQQSEYIPEAEYTRQVRKEATQKQKPSTKPTSRKPKKATKP
jgi:integrating conjugative element protein (TIGR03761 family)